MNAINKIIDKIGTDKVMHFLVGAWIVSALSPAGWGAVKIGIVLVVFLSLLKELFFDDERDWYDVLAAVIGVAVSVFIFLFESLFI